MRVLITGGDGQLGECLRKAVKPNSINEYIFESKKNLDITDYNSVLHYVKDMQIGIIINCAAYTNVDNAELNPDCAKNININGVGNLATALKETGGTLIHISSDYIFGGKPYNIPISEDDEPCPLGMYGWTKLEGEREIIQTGVNALIFRTSWLYSEFGNNFLKTIRSLLASRPQINVVFDQVGTPTYACDLANSLYHIVEKKLYENNEGIYNYTNEGVCSWFDFAINISQNIGNSTCKINPCRSSEFKTIATRPSFSLLDKSKFKKTFSLTIPYWTDSLKVCLENLKNI